MIWLPHPEVMFELHCHHCHKDYVVGSQSIRSTHRTSGGPVAYVTCPRGHTVIRYLRHEAVAREPLAAAS